MLKHSPIGNEFNRFGLIASPNVDHTLGSGLVTTILDIE